MMLKANRSTMNPIDFYSGPHEECGVIAVYDPHGEAARTAFYGLFALQHRGQEAAGIASFDERMVHLKKDIGLVSQVFSEEDIRKLPGKLVIGHNRYSTTGLPSAKNAQPFVVTGKYGPIAIAHNGNIVNANGLRRELLEKGIGLTSTSDTELMLMSLGLASGKTWVQRMRNAIKTWVGAFSFVLLTEEGFYAVRDPWGFRPLSYGKTSDGAFVAASETCALSTLGCTEFFEIPAGAILFCSHKGEIELIDYDIKKKPSACLFEYIYFSRPDSIWNGLSIHLVRRKFGEELAKVAPVEADMVIPVPDSSISAAIGYAHESRIPYGEAFVKNRYIGRTFIEPTTTLRQKGVRMKFNVLKDSVEGKRLIVIDDSIVRGNTIKPLVTLLLHAGAREVHVRVASPPVKYPCRMGVDMGEREDLVANRLDAQELARWSGAVSLEYLPLDSIKNVLGIFSECCTACFSGDYPFKVGTNNSKTQFEP
mgnify:CR=1 FL=1